MHHLSFGQSNPTACALAYKCGMKPIVPAIGMPAGLQLVPKSEWAVC
jgi:hypothetical protein